MPPLPGLSNLAELDEDSSTSSPSAILEPLQGFLPLQVVHGELQYPTRYSPENPSLIVRLRGWRSKSKRGFRNSRSRGFRLTTRWRPFINVSLSPSNTTPEWIQK